MKRTHKRGALGDVATVIAQAGSVADAAKRLGVQRSTIHRWIKAGKVPTPSWMGSPGASEVGAKPGQSPDDWAATVRAEYPLDATGEQLLRLAVQALQTALNLEERPNDRHTAMGRYQQLVKQLNLQASAAGARPPAPVPRPAALKRTGTDPRAILMAVK